MTPSELVWKPLSPNGTSGTRCRGFGNDCTRATWSPILNCCFHLRRGSPLGGGKLFNLRHHHRVCEALAMKCTRATWSPKFLNFAPLTRKLVSHLRPCHPLSLSSSSYEAKVDGDGCVCQTACLHLKYEHNYIEPLLQWSWMALNHFWLHHSMRVFWE